jgi:hypothetical protein
VQMRPIEDTALHLGETPEEEHQADRQVRDVRQRDNEDRIIGRDGAQLPQHRHRIGGVLQHIAADDRAIGLGRQRRFLHRTDVYGPVEGARPLGPIGVRLYRIEDQAAARDELRQNPLRRADIEDREAPRRRVNRAIC